MPGPGRDGILLLVETCGCSSLVEYDIPKVGRRVRFPSAAVKSPSESSEGLFPFGSEKFLYSKLKEKQRSKETTDQQKARRGRNSAAARKRAEILPDLRGRGDFTPPGRRSPRCPPCGPRWPGRRRRTLGRGAPCRPPGSPSRWRCRCRQHLPPPGSRCR